MVFRGVYGVLPMNVFSQLAGSGPEVVLAHGFAGSARNFRGLIRALSPDFRVLTYDARGHARSPAPHDPQAYSMDLLVSDLLGLLDGEGMTSPVVLGGLSMGAATALQFARMYPNRVRALVLISYPLGTGGSTGLSGQALEFAQAIEDVGVEAAGEKFVWGPGSGTSREMGKQVRAGFLEHSAQGLAGILRGVISKWPAPMELGSELEEIPVFVISGEMDPDSRRASELLVGQNHHIQTKVIPGAGHVVNLSQPVSFNSAFIDFLHRLPDAGEVLSGL